jgi:hypothetical protein
MSMDLHALLGELAQHANGGVAPERRRVMGNEVLSYRKGTVRLKLDPGFAQVSMPRGMVGLCPSLKLHPIAAGQLAVFNVQLPSSGLKLPPLTRLDTPPTPAKRPEPALEASDEPEAPPPAPDVEEPSSEPEGASEEVLEELPPPESPPEPPAPHVEAIRCEGQCPHDAQCALDDAHPGTHQCHGCEPDAFDDMSRAELKDAARGLNIKGSSRLGETALRVAVRRSMNE